MSSSEASWARRPGPTDTPVSPLLLFTFHHLTFSPPPASIPFCSLPNPIESAVYRGGSGIVVVWVSSCAAASLISPLVVSDSSLPCCAGVKGEIPTLRAFPPLSARRSRGCRQPGRRSVGLGGQ